MPGSLQPITKSPAGRTDVRGLWAHFAPLVALYNAMCNFSIVTNSGRNRLTLTEGNAVLELNITGTAAAAAVLTPWQPYAAPYTGGGDPPADQGLKIMIRPGTMNTGAGPLLPATKDIVLTVPPSCTEGFYVWLEADLDSGNGNVLSLDYGSGTVMPGPVTLPQPTPTGSYPPAVYDVLFMITSNETTVDLANVIQERSTPLALVAIQVVSDVNSTFSAFITPEPNSGT